MKPRELLRLLLGVVMLALAAAGLSTDGDVALMALALLLGIALCTTAVLRHRRDRGRRL